MQNGLHAVFAGRQLTEIFDREYRAIAIESERFTRCELGHIFTDYQGRSQTRFADSAEQRLIARRSDDDDHSAIDRLRDQPRLGGHFEFQIGRRRESGE